MGRGGHRENAGRKKKEPTVSITLRVPTRYRAELTAFLKKTAALWVAERKIVEVGEIVSKFTEV